MRTNIWTIHTRSKIRNISTGELNVVSINQSQVFIVVVSLSIFTRRVIYSGADRTINSRELQQWTRSLTMNGRSRESIDWGQYHICCGLLCRFERARCLFSVMATTLSRAESIRRWALNNIKHYVYYKPCDTYFLCKQKYSSLNRALGAHTRHQDFRRRERERNFPPSISARQTKCLVEYEKTIQCAAPHRHSIWCQWNWNQ